MKIFLKHLGVLVLLVGLAVSGLAAYRTTTIEMTPQIASTIASGVGGMYVKTSDTKPHFVTSDGAADYAAGDAWHIHSTAGAPSPLALGDCWTDTTDSYKLWCKESSGNIRQRFVGTAPGPLGCGGTPAAGCFTTLDASGLTTVTGGIALAGAVTLAGYPQSFLAHADTAAATVYLGGADRGAAAGSQVVLFVAPAAGTLRALTCSCGTAPGGIVFDVYTVQKSTNRGASWAATTGTCTITGSAKTCADATHHPTVAQYDWLAVEIVKDAASVSATYNCQVNVQ